MTRYVALLRAVNVGGTGALAMTALKAIGVGAGFARVRTYIASGNLVFDSEESSARVTAALEERLDAHMGKRVGVVLRSAGELRAVLDGNPFAACAGEVHARDFSRPRAAARRAGSRDQPSGGRNAAGRARNLRSLSPWRRAFALENPGGRARYGAQHETIARLVEMAFPGLDDALDQSSRPDRRRRESPPPPTRMSRLPEWPGALDDAFLLHALDQRGGLVVADRKPPLDVARRRLAVARRDGDGAFVVVAGLVRASGGIIRPSSKMIDIRHRSHISLQMPATTCR